MIVHLFNFLLVIFAGFTVILSGIQIAFSTSADTDELTGGDTKPRPDTAITEEGTEVDDTDVGELEPLGYAQSQNQNETKVLCN